MDNIELFIYNSFWYYTAVTELCSSLFTKIRTHCGCSRKISEFSLDQSSENLLFKKYYNTPNLTTYYRFAEKNTTTLHDDYTICDYEFIEINIILNDTQTFSVVMNKQNSNFYCVDNVLNHNFFEWYLKTYHNFKSLEKNTYTVTIIDNNVDEYTMGSDDVLTLNKESFKIDSRQ